MKRLKEIKDWKEMVNTVVCGDCLDGLKKIKDNSIDTIITDPPYGLSFMGKKWDYDVPKVEIWKEALRVLKPGGTALIFAGSRTQHRMAVNVEDAGFILKDCIMWLYGSGFPKATDISKQLDKGYKRELGEEKVSPDGIPATPEAQLWNGWKSHGLKPAYEPILVAMKPNEGSYANNALKHGVSGLNIDGGRIKTSEDTRRNAKGGDNGLSGTSTFKIRERKASEMPKQEGRFPSNVILDEEAAEMLDEQSGELSQCGGEKKTTHDKGMFGIGTPGKIYRETNRGASRFFYIAKAPKEEKNRLYGFAEEKANSGSYQFRTDGSLDGKPTDPKKNHHPTVKPLKLMEYLCTLTETPTKGIVLDPFMGSWTTALAAQNMGRDFIGFELSEDYCKIGEKRLAQQVMF